MKALVTGATSGIGKVIADYYDGWDYEVISVSRTAPEFKCDFTERNEIHDLLERLTDIGHIDVLVNNAGAMYLGESHSHTNALYHLLLYTPYMLMTHLEGNLQNGHIINIASVSGIVADPEVPVYSAMKAGLISLTKSFAKIYAPDIRVNCISPGFFNTNLVPGPAPRSLINKVPMKREAEPVEIKQVIDMIDQSPYMTGANIVIDGGLSL